MSPRYEIKPGVYWVGAKDWDRRIFDALIPLPQGTSYNAYLVVGEKASALIDTVNPGFEEDLWQKLSALINPKNLDYVVMNHAEPDHAGALPWILERAPKAKVLLTEKGKEMAICFYHVPEGRLETIHDGDHVDLGGRTLRFWEVPFVHWPETMFTFLVEEGILFPCDFFGAHTAKGFYAEDIPDIEPLAKSYFGEIMMPYGRAARRALEKAMELKPAMIAPSHGPVWRNPQPILSWYRKWTAGETEPKVLVAYVSMWGATEMLVQVASEELRATGVAVATHELSRADLGRLAADLVDSRALVFGTPTVLGGLHPLAAFALNLVRTLKPPVKFAVVLASHGWAGGAVRQARQALQELGPELLGVVDVPGKPKEQELQRVRELMRELARRTLD
ncbi:MAG: FprA family A-type flavoprotein [Candidatus Bipolaricaulaceae bacterium]